MCCCKTLDKNPVSQPDVNEAVLDALEQVLTNVTSFKLCRNDLEFLRSGSGDTNIEFKVELQWCCVNHLACSSSTTTTAVR